MRISQLLLNEDFPLKFFYCFIDNKEYILCGDDSGLIYDCFYTSDIGTIITEAFENNEFIQVTIKKYIDIILNEKYSKDEVFNQEIIWNILVKLQKELITSKIKCFSYIDIPTYIAKTFIENFNNINIEKEKYNNSEDTIKNLKQILDVSSFPENQAAIDMIERIKEKHLFNINNLERITFKKFTLEKLNKFLYDFNLLELYLIIYSSKNIDRDIISKFTDETQNNFKNPLQAMKFLQQNFNLNIFNDFYKLTCFSKLAIYNNGKLYLDGEIDSLDNKNFDFDMRIIEIFKFDNFIELLNLSLVRIMDKKIVINRCLNCGNLFIPQNRTDEKYCNKISPQNSKKTCKQYGAKKTYRDEIKSIPIKHEHNKTSQFFRMRINRTNTNNTKEKEMYQKKFNTYKENYQKKKKQYQSGKLKEKDFVEWIIKQKEGVKNGSTRNNKK
ncbi:MAG: hypothetical protein HFJ37_05745 [Clostridia bacterium]|nr:hypothetical protein [Clostridia bacterium]